MRQLTSAQKSLIVRLLSKLPMRQLTQSASVVELGKFSKLPMRQLTVRKTLANPVFMRQGIKISDFTLFRSIFSLD